MDGENKPGAETTTESNRRHTDAAAGRSSLRSTETQTQSGKRLPILFLPANHNGKERESYWGERDQVKQKIKVVSAH